jgi:hypothetical protein
MGARAARLSCVVFTLLTMASTAYTLVHDAEVSAAAQLTSLYETHSNLRFAHILVNG